MSNVIEVRNLTKKYGKSRGVIKLNLNVEKNDFFGFIGPNGAGKSTTIRTILGLIKPTLGTAEVFGMDSLKFRDKDVYKRQGWFYTNSGWYFFDSDSGEKMSGWVYTDNSWYYLDPNDDGKMKTGWFYTDSSWYYLNDSGSMVTGWLEWNNKNYYLGEDGRMQTKWFYTNSGWYFFNPDGGEKMTGWIRCV